MEAIAISRDIDTVEVEVGVGQVKPPLVPLGGPSGTACCQHPPRPRVQTRARDAVALYREDRTASRENTPLSGHGRQIGAPAEGGTGEGELRTTTALLQPSVGRLTSDTARGRFGNALKTLLACSVRVTATPPSTGTRGSCGQWHRHRPAGRDDAEGLAYRAGLAGPAASRAATRGHATAPSRRDRR